MEDGFLKLSGDEVEPQQKKDNIVRTVTLGGFNPQWGFAGFV